MSHVRKVEPLPFQLDALDVIFFVDNASSKPMTTRAKEKMSIVEGPANGVVFAYGQPMWHKTEKVAFEGVLVIAVLHSEHAF